MTLEEVRAAAEKIKNRMEEMTAEKKRELLDLSIEKDERVKKLEAANAKMQSAESVKEYAKARAESKDLQAEVEYYDMKIEERKNRPFISEAESDAIIDELLELEKDGERAFSDTVLSNLDELKKDYDEYGRIWRSIENIISRWTREIHPNFRGFGTTYFVDGKPTNRSPKPVPIRGIPYNGGKIYETADTFMMEAEKLRKEKDNV